MGWETVLHESFIFLHILEADALMAFALDYIFKDVCVANNLTRQTVPPSRHRQFSFLSSKEKIMSSYGAEIRQT